MAGVDYRGQPRRLRLRARQRTFYDDRFDMFPEDVSEAHVALAQGASTFRSELDRLDIDLVTAVSTSGAGRSSSATPPGG